MAEKITEHSEEQSTCSICGEVHDLCDLTATPDGYVVCPDCLDEHYYKCYHCGELVRRDRAMPYHEDYICPRCYEQHYETCEDCDEVVRRTDAVYVNRHGWVCDSCYDDGDYHMCHHCDDIYPESDMAYIDGEWYCEDCAPEDEGSRLHEYSYKPSARFFTRKGESYDPPAELTFGVELEMCDSDKDNVLNRCVGAIHSTFPNVYCKYDGSLSYDGIEAVTHPATLDYHLYEMRWAELCRIATKEYGYHSHDTNKCGLHIHVGREQLGASDTERDSTAAKAVLLVYRHWAKLLKFSRRRENELRWCEKNYVDPNRDYTERKLRAQALDTNLSGHGDRYLALNLTNDYTIEFRLFKGSLKRDTIVAAIELVNNICKYAMSHSIAEVCKSSWLDVVNFEQFSELRSYCEEKELLGEEYPADIRLLSDEEFERRQREYREAEERRVAELRAQREAAAREAAEREAHAAEERRRAEAEAEAFGLRVGDRVIVVDSSGYDVAASSIPGGARGTVVYTPNCLDWREDAQWAPSVEHFNYAVLFDFDESVERDGMGRHHIGRRLPNDCGDGYNVHAHNIIRINEYPDGRYAPASRLRRRSQTPEEMAAAFDEAIARYRRDRYGEASCACCDAPLPSSINRAACAV